MSEVLSEERLQAILKQSEMELVEMVAETGDIPTKVKIEEMRKLRAHVRRMNDIEDGIDPDLGA